MLQPSGFMQRLTHLKKTPCPPCSRHKDCHPLHNHLWHTERTVSCSVLFSPFFSINWSRHIMLSTWFSEYDFRIIPVTSPVSCFILEQPHPKQDTQYSTGLTTSSIHGLMLPLTPFWMKSASFSAKIPPNCRSSTAVYNRSPMIASGISSDATDKAVLPLTCKWTFLWSNFLGLLSRKNVCNL